MSKWTSLFTLCCRLKCYKAQRTTSAITDQTGFNSKCSKDEKKPQSMLSQDSIRLCIAFIHLISESMLRLVMKIKLGVNTQYWDGVWFLSELHAAFSKWAPLQSYYLDSCSQPRLRGGKARQSGDFNTGIQYKRGERRWRGTKRKFEG